MPFKIKKKRKKEEKVKMMSKKETRMVIGSILIVIILAGSMAYLISRKEEIDYLLSMKIHITVEHYRDGKLLSVSHHAGTLTNIGKDWIEDQLGDSPSTDPAKWISCSNDATAPDVGWTQIPSEIDANGVTRAEGTYVSTGTGTWNISKTFSVTGTQSVKLYGLQYGATPQSDNNLLCADTSSVKNLENGDTLKVTFQCSVS